MFWRGGDVTELLDNRYDYYVSDHTLTQQGGEHHSNSI